MRNPQKGRGCYRKRKAFPLILRKESVFLATQCPYHTPSPPDNLYKDLTADRDSLKKENESLTAQQEKIEKELASTKEMNFTLARQVGKAGSEKKSLDDMLKDFFYGKEKN